MPNDAIGDSGVAGPAQAEILRRIALEPRKPAFILHTGDMAYPNGTFAELEQNHFAPARDLLRQVCLFATPGNHEYYSELGGPFLSAFSPPLEGVPAQGRGRLRVGEVEAADRSPEPGHPRHVERVEAQVLPGHRAHGGSQPLAGLASVPPQRVGPSLRPRRGRRTKDR